MSTALRCHKCGYDFSGSGDSAHVCLQQPRAQPKQEQEPTSGFFSREAMKEHSDFHPQPKQEQGEPKQEDYLSKAYRLANELRCHLAIAPAPQHREWVDLNGEELETLLSENRTLTLGAIWAVADKLKEKNT